LSGAASLDEDADLTAIAPVRADTNYIALRRRRSVDLHVSAHFERG